jgi:membrane protein insertase Oxa1/YidC/SpoIIIJ
MFTFLSETVKFNGLIHQYLLDNFPGALDRKWYMVTLMPVIFGIMRYMQLIYEKNQGESPHKVLMSDRPLLFVVALWGLMVVGILYFA